MAIKKAKFNGWDIEIGDIRLPDANLLFPFVVSGMTKVGLGMFDFFKDFPTDFIHLLEKKACEYTTKIVREEQEPGVFVVVRSKMTLSDLDECVRGVIPFLLAFLEHNFVFFSGAQQMIEDMMKKEPSENAVL